MKDLLALFFIFILTLFSVVSVAQNSQQRDCIHPKEIQFSDKEKLFSSEEIYYEEDDSYTFWYKITSNISQEINYELKSIQTDDDYEMLIYSYAGNNFCNDLIKKKEIKPLKTNSKGTIKINKNQSFYINILHLNGKGCGHELLLINSNLKFHFRAIQNTCVEEIVSDVIEEIIKQDSIVQVLQSKKNVIVEKIIKDQPDIKEIVVEPLQETRFNGFVINKTTKQPVEAEIKVIYSTAKEKKKLFSSVNNGFNLTLDNNNPLIISIEKLGYLATIDTIYNFDTTVSILIEPIRVGEKIIMHKIYFHPNTAVLKSTSKKELESLFAFMKENEAYSYEIQGHTNGNRKIKKDKKNAHLNEEWNFSGTAKELSQLRAEKIKTFLQEKGVKDKNLIAKGYGGDKMIVEHPKNMQEAMKNIRVEIIVIK